MRSKSIHELARTMGLTLLRANTTSSVERVESNIGERESKREKKASDSPHTSKKQVDGLPPLIPSASIDLQCIARIKDSETHHYHLTQLG